MKAIMRFMFLFVLAGTISGAAMHEYYVAVFKVEHIAVKKQLQVTARIFIDDLDAELSQKYNRQFYLCTSKEIKETDDYLKKYFAEKFQISINGKHKSLKFLGREAEDNTLICYFTTEAKGKVNSLTVKNSILFETQRDQQNIINAKIKSNKKSLLLTNSEPAGSLQF